MVESSTKKKDLFYIIVLILTLITMIIGATFAYFKLVGSQKEDNTILYTGTLKINYINGTEIENPELLPIENVDYNTHDKVYRNNFEITSTGTLDQTISIDLEITQNDFQENSLKYILYSNQGKQLATGNVPKSGTINLTNNVYLGSKETAKYTLIIWWNSTNTNQSDEIGSVITGRINADAKQIRR